MGENNDQVKFLVFILFITTIYLIIEAIAGYIINSLALLADAGHMINDLFSILLALFAIAVSKLKSTKNYTFGFQRVEVLTGLINGISLLAISTYITYNSLTRFLNSNFVAINGSIMFIVAFLGLIVNLIAMKLLHRYSKNNINIEGTYKHVIADLMGSIATIIASITILLWKLFWMDLFVSLIISILIFRSGFLIISKAIRILLVAFPQDKNFYEIKKEILNLQGINEIHDLHCWTLTSGKDIITGHIRIDKNSDPDEILNKLTYLAAHKYGFFHSTFQIELINCQLNDCLEIKR